MSAAAGLLGPEHPPRSAVSGIAWPAVVAPVPASLLAMQFQLAQSEWWTAEELEAAQALQLLQVLEHARRTVPHYRDLAWDAGGGLARLLASLPLLDRARLRDSHADLCSKAMPADHGRVGEGYTSGSTGTPVRYAVTELGHFFFGALVLREHLWQRRDFRRKLAVIRAGVEPGSHPGWGPATDPLFQTGPRVVLNIGEPVSAQLDWLLAQQPAYLLTHPSNLAALVRESRRRGLRPAGLVQARTFGELVTPELRAAVAEAWGVPLVDSYSAEEVGHIALECPQSGLYHVQSENLVVEVLDAEDRPCAPGQVGRVVVSTLHNFAMPLIRYQLGDYAEVAGPCPCGRGLPALRRILGRRRNMLRLPDGSSHWPYFNMVEWAFIEPIRAFQVAQTALDQVEVRLVLARDLDAGEEERLRVAIRKGLGHPFQVALRRVDSLDGAGRGKFEDFVSLLGDD